MSARLTEIERDWLREITDTITGGLWTETHDPLLFTVVERIVDAHLHTHGSEGWASYAAEQERHAETRARLDEMTREAQASRRACENAVRASQAKFARHEIERAFRVADAPEDSMATEDDLLRYEGRAEAVEIMRDILGLGSPPYVCHGCGGIFTPGGDDA